MPLDGVATLIEWKLPGKSASLRGNALPPRRQGERLALVPDLRPAERDVLRIRDQRVRSVAGQAVKVMVDRGKPALRLDQRAPSLERRLNAAADPDRERVGKCFAASSSAGRAHEPGLSRVFRPLPPSHAHAAGYC